MVITPFIISRIHNIVQRFIKEEVPKTDISTLEEEKNHVIVCGYSVVGKVVTEELYKIDAHYVIIDNNLKHVREGIAKNEKIFFGDMEKPSALHALHVENAAAVIVTLDNAHKKRLICEAVLRYTKDVNLIVKVVSLEEKEMLADLPITVIVDGKVEVARVLVERMLTCQLKY